MNKLLALLFCLAFYSANAQSDTTIYQITEIKASFPGCNWDWFSEQQKDSCRQYAMMDFLKTTLRYPSIARDSNISGRVVVRFVVEPNGTLSNIKLLKDIGGGCGDEAIRIVNLMNQMGVRWIPGRNQGKIVRSYFTLPVSFKLQEDPGYTIVDGNPVFYLFDTPLKYKEGDEALANFLNKNLILPRVINDSCKLGVIQAEVLIRPDGYIKPLQIDDFSNLGFDAQFEAIQVITKTINKWEYATYKSKAVPTSCNIRVIFKPNVPKCKSKVDKFEKAYAKINEAIAHSDKQEWELSLQKFNEGILLQPQNIEAYYLRGLVYMNMKKNDEACADFQKVKANLNVNWVDNILPLICK
jgi:TonB family protein